MSTHQSPNHRRTNATAAAAAIAVLVTISGCASAPGAPGAASAPAPGPSRTATVTVTRTVPGGTTTPRATLGGAPSTPPPARVPAYPTDSASYAKAFVAAWVASDRTRAAQLGSDAAVKAAFAVTAGAPPTFKQCEGAAGSSYCTWQGDEATMTVRVMNEAASEGQPHAVAEVRFAH